MLATDILSTVIDWITNPGDRLPADYDANALNAPTIEAGDWVAYHTDGYHFEGEVTGVDEARDLYRVEHYTLWGKAEHLCGGERLRVLVKWAAREDAGTSPHA